MSGGVSAMNQISLVNTSAVSAEHSDTVSYYLSVIMRSTMMILLLIASCLSLALADKSSESFTFDRSLARMSTYITTEHYVYHMEMDQYKDGNILFSDLSALKSTDGNITKAVAGQSTESEYREGVSESARFHLMTGFYQLSSRKVVVADFGNHCLRLIDRLSGQTHTFAGNCTKSGYADGSQALFYNPRSVIPDNKNQDNLLITNQGNKALRSVDIHTAVVSTFFRDEALNQPYGITQDVLTGNLYLTTQSAVYKLHYQTKELTLIAGDPTQRGYRDGDFSVSQFNYPKELLLLDKGRKLRIADHSNHRLRRLDMETNITDSLCTGTLGHTDGDMDGCSLSYPLSLMVLGDSLYIRERWRIRKLSGQTYTTPTTTPRLTITKMSKTGAATSSTMSPPPSGQTYTTPTTTPRLTTTMRSKTGTATSSTMSPPPSDSPPSTKPPITSPCRDQNITVYTDAHTDTARVQLADGVTYTDLPEGTYTFRTQNITCVTSFHIINNKTDFNSSLMCSAEKEYVLSSSSSGEGSLDITCGDVIHRLRLPIGNYTYDKIQEDYNCSTTVKVTDYQLVRRLNIKAEYDIRCALLSDPITKAAVISVADSHSIYIDGPTICGRVCKRQKDGDIKTTCVDDTLSILWPTDQTYEGVVTEVPSSVKSIIGPRLSQFGSQTFGLFIMRLQPPVVRPVRTGVVLVSSCQNNNIYVEDTDSCV